MNFYKTNEYSEPSESIVPDVLEQIKKRNEEFSTSDASKLLQSITNPTNLTNPQIINSLSRRKIDNNRIHLPSLKNRIILKSNGSNFNAQKFLVRSNSNIVSRNKMSSFSKEYFDFKYYQKIVEKAEEIYEEEEKKRIKKIIDKINRSNDNTINSYNNFSCNNKLRNKRIDKIGSYEDIWEKAKKSQSVINNKEKNIRINFKKFIPRKEIIEKFNNIKIINFSNRNKNKRYQKFLSMKALEIKTADIIIKKLESSKDFLENKYKEQYKEYILYLKKVAENETLKRDDIVNVKINLMEEIHNLEKQIEKMKNQKKLILDWIYLQIRVKKKILTLPLYYKYIIEDNIPYKIINKMSQGNYLLHFDEYNEILNYKKECIYDDAEDFIRDFNRVQMKALNKYNEEDIDLFLRKNEMENELQELKNQNESWEINFNKKFKQLSLELKYLINKNEKLVFKLNYYRTEKPIKKALKDRYIMNKLAFYANINSNSKGCDIIEKDDKPTIFYVTMCLYHIVTSLPLPELKNKKLILNPKKTDIDNMLNIFEYTSFFIDAINKRRNNYFSNIKTKELYQKIKADIDKEVIRERIHVKAEMKKKMENYKKERLLEKLNKNYVRKIGKFDFVFHKKEKNIKNISLDMDIKTKTRFENFLYDIYT